jgi:hypothetical protein
VFDGNGQQIADKPQVRAFLIEDGQVTEEPVVISGILTRVKDFLARVLSRFQ